MTPRRPPAIVLGGRETAVPVARSLAAAGIEVHAAGSRLDPLRHSRACVSYTALDAPDLQAAWLDWLRATTVRGVILPSCDDAIELVAAHRAELSALGYICFEADDDVIRAMLDKAATYEIAARGGVPIPATATVRDEGDIAAALGALPLPCGVKPLTSHRFVAATGITDKVLVAHDRAELERLLRLGVSSGSPVMATEIIPGPDDLLFGYITYVKPDGEPVFELTNRKLRQEPPHFGVGCYIVNQYEPDVAEVGRRFVHAAGLVGVAHVEFKRDPRDGELKLIECNHRFHLGTQGVRLAGVDIPLIAYARMAGEDVPKPSPRYGARLWHPVSDLRSLRASRTAGEITVGDWAKTLLHRQHLTVWSARDPLPSLVLHGRIVRDFTVRRVARVLRQRSRRAPSPRTGVQHA